MADCNSCAAKDKCSSNKETCKIKNNPKNKIKNIITVMSGKGGVGKSTISVELTRALNRKGYKVGIMDADITGPSVPRLLNIEDKKARADKLDIYPVETDEAIKVMSLNLLLKDENQPAIWRGPILSGIVEQFWTDVVWGELDYLVIDMPPGTGDIALTTLQSIPISGVVMVSLPQDMVSMIVNKAINMVKKVNIPLLGIVQNMSYIDCDCCGERIKIFDSLNIDEFLENNKTELLGELPMKRSIAEISNNGLRDKDIEVIFENITEKIREKLK